MNSLLNSLDSPRINMESIVFPTEARNDSRGSLKDMNPFAHSVYNGHTPTLVRVHEPLRMPQDTTKGELESSCIRSAGDPFAEGESVAPGTLSVIDNLGVG